MKKIFLFIVLSAFMTGLSAQKELQRLLTTYTESVRLPFYKECKMRDDRIPKSVDGVTLDGVWLTVKYVVHNSSVTDIDRGEYNNYTVRIDLSKSDIARINNRIEITCKEGIEVTEENGSTGKKYPFLIEKWTINCNDLPLCNKIFDAMRDFGTLEVDASAMQITSENNLQNSGNGSWSLAGRSLKGRLVEPSNSGNEQGTIVVTIRVDASGKVIDAIIGTGTTITSPSMRLAAMEAAKKNVFTAGDSMAFGTITYEFTRH